MTVDPRTIRDIGLAVLLALPTAALTRPTAPDTDRHAVTATPHQQFADKPLQQRFSLPG